jgi:hypothetical protein
MDDQNISGKGRNFWFMDKNGKMKKSVKRRLAVPIYGAVVWLVIDDHIHERRVEMSDLFGEAPERHDYEALCSYDEAGTFGLFFTHETFTPAHIAHEVFHLTHAILQWQNCAFDKNHDEYGALLCGYITQWIMTG